MDWDEPPEPLLCAGNRRLSGGGREKAHSCREKQRQDEWCAQEASTANCLGSDVFLVPGSDPL